MAPEGGGGSRSGGRYGGQVMKKGPWTAAEDAILTEYVKKHSEGNWNSVQRISGLKRCGKSCRLRWANHLRPNLKKGTFSAEEETLIVELHAKLGNKWARMAAQLPGRTDNEIKNYWNTRTKRRQRAGLPIYPPDIQPKHHHNLDHQQSQPNHPNSSSSSLPSLLSSWSSSKDTYNLNLPLFTNFSSSSFLPSHNRQFKLFRGNNGGLALSLASPSLPFPGSSDPLLSTPSFQFNSQTYHKNAGPNMGVSFNPINSVSARAVELPSIQSSLDSSDGDDYEIAPEFSMGNSTGLLEDLLEESHALTRSDKSKKLKLAAENEDLGNCVSDEGLMEDETVALPVESFLMVDHHGMITAENLWEDSSSANLSIGMKRKNNPVEDMDSLDEDFVSLLDSFPLTVPIPDWDDKSRSLSNDEPWNMTDDNVAINPHQEVPCSPVVTIVSTPHHDWALGSCYWNNLPDICEELS